MIDIVKNVLVKEPIGHVTRFVSSSVEENVFYTEEIKYHVKEHYTIEDIENFMMIDIDKSSELLTEKIYKKVVLNNLNINDNLYKIYEALCKFSSHKNSYDEIYIITNSLIDSELKLSICFSNVIISKFLTDNSVIIGMLNNIYVVNYNQRFDLIFKGQDDFIKLNYTQEELLENCL